MFPTDAEFSDFFNRLNAKYAGPEMNRPPIEPPCHVDPIGMGRWNTDYYIHRQNGNTHEQAWAKVNKSINDILGIPTIP